MLFILPSIILQQLLYETSSENILRDEMSDDSFEKEDDACGDDGNFQYEFAHLLNLLRKDEYNQVPDAHLVVSKNEILLAILTYVNKFSMPNDGTVGLCQMINTFFGYSLVPSIRYFIDKYFYPRESIEYHAVCPTCKMHIKPFSRNEPNVFCKICEVYVNLKSSVYRDYFAILDIGDEIKDLIESNHEYYTEVISGRR